MTTVNETLAVCIENATKITAMMIQDLTPAEWLHRPCAKANCAAWTVGHLILSGRSMMKRAGATDLPELPAGFEERYARNETAPHANEYGDTSVLPELFNQTHARFAAAARAATAEQLSVPMDHPMFKSVGAMLAFAPVHIATHAGQLSTIRRSLGRPPLV